MKFLKRLNWSGFIFMLIVSGLGSFTRDLDFQKSLLFWLYIGVPCSLVFLLVRTDDKNNDHE